MDILYQCSSNSLYFSGNSKNRAGEAFFFSFSQNDNTDVLCVGAAVLFLTEILFNTTHKTSVLLFCEKEKKAAIRRRRRILRLENYGCVSTHIEVSIDIYLIVKFQSHRSTYVLTQRTVLLYAKLLESRSTKRS